MNKRSAIKTILLPGLVLGAFAVPASAQDVGAPRVYDDFPKWSQFPPPPTDVPTPAQIRQQVVALKATAVNLQRTADALPWELKEPDAMAASAKAKIDPVLGAPVETGVDNAATETMAARLRARATPPPVAK
ncbi:hypothetical protein [Asticcacaulis sp. AND118]|uniref:hypothetical protein n=1 Tax=Asticcacaulis sp. AND118 TaxID=2840468 RepID=UPI001CFFC4DD|nr:hypothetical protein [Asticcacaulis sp. AND118]UDF02307.1 hypothetical protein LH365_07550 [Asticcacaulis sp. AND118]